MSSSSSSPSEKSSSKRTSFSLGEFSLSLSSELLSTAGMTEGPAASSGSEILSLIGYVGPEGSNTF